MLYSRTYSRLFITLKQDRSDFCYDLRPAMGRCIIEIRNNNGKIMIFAQGLKPRVLYRVILVNGENDSYVGINGGLINIDEKGKGDVSIAFEPDNVLSSGLKIESISAVLIIVDGIGEIAAPLVGFRDKSFVWKNNFKILNNEEKRDNSALADGIDIVENEISDDNNIIDDTKVNTGESSEVFSEEKQAIAEKADDNKEEISKTETNNNAEIKADKLSEKINTESKEQPQNKSVKVTDFNAFLEKFKKDMLELEHYAFMTEADRPKRRGRGIQSIEYIKKYNQRIKPFEKYDENTYWYKIMPCELTAVNANLWRHLNSPFINSCFKKYKHLILGVKNEKGKESYVIGVPEKYDDSFVIEARTQGFNRFLSREDKALEEGAMGYWLLDVD